MNELIVAALCKGNPGPGEWQFTLIDEKGEAIADKGKEERTTNNQLLIIAARNGLARLQKGSRVLVRTNSQYLTNVAQNKKAREGNRDLLEALDAVCATLDSTWVIDTHIEQIEVYKVGEHNLAVRDGRKHLGESFYFLEGNGRNDVLNSFVLLNAPPKLLEYSSLVMPISRAFEGYLMKLAVHLKLIQHHQIATGQVNVGSIFDAANNGPAQKIAATSADKKGLLKMLVGEYPYSRNFLMHSNPTRPDLPPKN